MSTIPRKVKILAAGTILVLATCFLPAQEGADNHVVVVNDGVEEAYVKAIEVLVETAWKGYVEDLGLPMPELITVHLSLDPENKLKLYTDGKSRVFLKLASMDQLKPSPKSGVFNIYGFCHELGHIAQYHRMKTVAAINPGVAEAWAHLCGSAVCDYVYGKKGRKLWPEPYDYKKVEGTARIRRDLKKRTRGEATDFDTAVKGFWNLYLVVKKKKFFKAADACLKTRPSGDEFLPRFLEEARKVSRKKRMPEFFPEKLLKKQFSWNPGPPDLKSKATFKDLLVSDKKNDAVKLHYHPGKPDPSMHRSIGGTAYFQVFQAPGKAGGRVVAVELFGYRYGRRADDDEEILVWICDAGMKVLHEHKIRYRDLNSTGECAWFRIPGLKPVEVTRHFYVGVFFDASATKGYFMGYQKKVHGHSYQGTPATGLELLKGQDWIMRVEVETGKPTQR